jgi:hypothetical protein
MESNNEQESIAKWSEAKCGSVSKNWEHLEDSDYKYGIQKLVFTV